MKAYSVSPQEVHSTLSRTMLVDGFDLVMDLKRSKGSMIYDARTSQEFIDFFSFFASSPIGHNHQKMQDPDFLSLIARTASTKPANSDIYTVEMAEFVQTFEKIAKPDYMKYCFFIDGGALGVENGLKAAFDWKVQKNFMKGLKEEKGRQVIHFKQAFHGRTGYTLSLTNTHPDKIAYFPKFKWPRITNPKITYPLEEHLDAVKTLESQAVDEIHKAIKENPNDIALIIIEPIQGEGGDNHFRKEFFQSLRQIADENEILLMFDEVQTGIGLTGKMWAHQYYTEPDLISFGKKVQVCGTMAGRRLDEVENNVFKKSGRINSTWGGNLTDMLRSKKYLEIIESENLVDRAKENGKYLLEELKNIQTDFPNLVSQARGLGLMCAFDLPSAAERDSFVHQCYLNNLVILGCGEKAVRFRPALDIGKDFLDKGLKIIRKVLYCMGQK